MAELLSVKIDSFSYEDRQVALKDIDLKVKEGEFILLTGLSGCGKSSLLRLIVDLVPEVYEGTLQGEILLKGKKIKDYFPGEIYKDIAFIFQDPKDQFFSTHVEDELALIGENLAMPRLRLISRVEDLIEQMQLEELRERTVFELSGGEKQRVCIAASLVYKSNLIILDEPSASLDYTSTLKLQELLLNLKAQGKTIIVAEHRLFYLSKLCDRLLYMQDKTIKGDYTRAELNYELGQSLNLRCFDEKDLKASSREKILGKSYEVKNLTIKRGAKLLLENLNFSFQAGEVMAIVGKNGIGKSSLARVLAGLDRLRGELSWAKNQRQALRKSYYLMQDVDQQIFFDTVENEVLTEQDQANFPQIKQLLQDLDLWDLRMHHPQELSSGEKQRLSMIVALCSQAEIIIMDEPTAGLDKLRMEDMAKAILAKAQSKAIILITHDNELLLQVADTVLLLDGKANRKLEVKNNQEEVLAFIRQ